MADLNGFNANEVEPSSSFDPLTAHSKFALIAPPRSSSEKILSNAPIITYDLAKV